MIAKQGNQKYVYRSVRQGDKVKRIYIGTEPSPEARKLKKEMEEKQKLREDRNKLDKLDSITSTISREIETLFSSHMLNNGFYYRKSEWRKGK